MFYTFIWDGKKDKISRDQLIKDYSDGGCKMIHLPSFSKSMKLSWVQRLFHSESSWKNLFLSMYKTDQAKLQSLGDFYPKLLTKNHSNDFWNEVMNTLHYFHQKLQKNNLEDILSAPLWYNSNILIGDTPVFCRSMFDLGIRFVSDLFDDKGVLHNYEYLCRIYNNRLPILTYLGLKNSIFGKWPFLREAPSNIPLPLLPFTFKFFSRNLKGSRHFYQTLIKNIKCNTKYIEKWQRDLQLNHTDLQMFSNYIFKCTSDYNLIWFQYRLTHRILGTNDLLFKINIKPSYLCSFCKKERETFTHLFLDCNFVSKIWKNLEDLIFEKCDLTIKFSPEDIIFSSINVYSPGLNIILLLAKKHIYNARVKGSIPSTETIKNLIKQYYCALSCQDKWSMLANLFV